MHWIGRTLVWRAIIDTDKLRIDQEWSGKKRLTATVYVDYLMIISNNVRTVDWLLPELTTKYDHWKRTRGTTHNYLGMVFDISQPPLIMINRQGIIEDIISSTKTNVMSANNIRPKVLPKTSAPTHLLYINVNSDLLQKCLKITFHFRVAKLTYIPTRTKQDLLERQPPSCPQRLLIYIFFHNYIAHYFIENLFLGLCILYTAFV